MSRKGLKFLGKITPQFPNMLTHAAEGEDSRDTLEGTNGNEGDQVQIPHDSPLSGGHTSDRAEGAVNLQELSILCTNLSNRVLVLESIKDAQAAEISALKSRIKKLEKKCKPSISHYRALLKSVKRLSMKKRFRKRESISKQGRKKSKPKSTLDDSTIFNDHDHGMKYMETKEAMDEGRQSVSTARPQVSTARPDIDAARQEDSAVEPRTPPTTTSIFDDEDITMAQTLIKMKEEKAKEKGVSIKDIEDSSRPTRSILTLKPLPTINPKDKGKSVLEEPEPAKKMTRKRERQKEEEASKAAIAETYDEVQVGIDADALLAANLQQEEREEYTIEEIAKFLAGTIAAQRKFRAAQRSAKIRSRPPTKSQLRNLMMTCLKNMGGYKNSQLKAKTFAEIQGLYERQKKVIDDFKPMDSDDAVKDSKEAAGVHKQKVLKIVLDEEEIIDYEVLEKRFPIINWESKFYDFDRHGAECIYYIIFRSDGNDDIWKNQEKLIIKSWTFYENYGVHILTLEDGTKIYMLAKRRYPLIRETLERMIELRLTTESEGEAVFDLLRFI
ncbi:hypothetical protein Tco_1260003 [Tanacetum coccineum]